MPLEMTHTHFGGIMVNTFLF